MVYVLNFRVHFVLKAWSAAKRGVNLKIPPHPWIAQVAVASAMDHNTSPKGPKYPKVGYI